MSSRLKLSLVAAITTLTLTACGSGDSDSGGSVSDQQLLSLIETSNLADGFPGLYVDQLYGQPLSQQGAVRFDSSSQIPLYYVSADGSQPPASITSAVAQIEARLGDIFSNVELLRDDLSVYRDNNRLTENVGNGSYHEQSFKNKHGILGGLVITEGTGFYDHAYSNNPQNMCANASIAPYSGSLSLLITESSHTYADTSLLWVNMGHAKCSWSGETVVHEMAHAMGMFKHVEPYFGHWSSTAMDMLDTLYSNPAGTPHKQLVPARG